MGLVHIQLFMNIFLCCFAAPMLLLGLNHSKMYRFRVGHVPVCGNADVYSQWSTVASTSYITSIIKALPAFFE